MYFLKKHHQLSSLWTHFLLERPAISSSMMYTSSISTVVCSMPNGLGELHVELICHSEIAVAQTSPRITLSPSAEMICLHTRYVLVRG